MLRDKIALAMINSDRARGGWPAVESRDTIPDSDGYLDCAEAALAVVLTELDEDWFHEAITDSLEMDWTPRDGAREIMRRLAQYEKDQNDARPNMG